MHIANTAAQHLMLCHSNQPAIARGRGGGQRTDVRRDRITVQARSAGSFCICAESKGCATSDRGRGSDRTYKTAVSSSPHTLSSSATRGPTPGLSFPSRAGSRGRVLHGQTRAMLGSRDGGRRRCVEGRARAQVLAARPDATDSRGRAQRGARRSRRPDGASESFHRRPLAHPEPHHIHHPLPILPRLGAQKPARPAPDARFRPARADVHLSQHLRWFQ